MIQKEKRLISISYGLNLIAIILLIGGFFLWNSPIRNSSLYNSTIGSKASNQYLTPSYLVIFASILLIGNILLTFIARIKEKNLPLKIVLSAKLITMLTVLITTISILFIFYSKNGKLLQNPKLIYTIEILLLVRTIFFILFFILEIAYVFVLPSKNYRLALKNISSKIIFVTNLTFIIVFIFFINLSSKTYSILSFNYYNVSYPYNNLYPMINNFSWEQLKSAVLIFQDSLNKVNNYAHAYWTPSLGAICIQISYIIALFGQFITHMIKFIVSFDLKEKKND